MIQFTMIALTAIAVSTNLSGRELQTYNGPYNGGTAQYTYYEDDDENRIYSGRFTFRSKYNSLSGVYLDGIRTGLWESVDNLGTGHGPKKSTVTFSNDGRMEGPMTLTLKGGGMKSDMREPVTMNFKMHNDRVISFGTLYQSRHKKNLNEIWKKLKLKGGFTPEGYPDGVWELTDDSWGETKSVRQEFRNGVLVKSRYKNHATGDIKRDDLNWAYFEGAPVTIEDFFEAYDSVTNTACLSNGNCYELVEEYIEPGNMYDNYWDMRDNSWKLGLPRPLPMIVASYIVEDKTLTSEYKGVPVKIIKYAGRGVRTQQRNNDSQLPESLSDVVYESVEHSPQFPGGVAAMMKWISEHLIYPQDAAERGVSGRVTVKFVVKNDGSVGDVVVTRGNDESLDAEAMRVVKSLPKFTPGKINGNPVNCWYTATVSFRMN